MERKTGELAVAGGSGRRIRRGSRLAIGRFSQDEVEGLPDHRCFSPQGINGDSPAAWKDAVAEV